MYEIIPILGIPLARGIGGWVENSLEDGKITVLEWKKLCITVLTLGVPALLLFYGLGAPVEFAATVPVFVDYVFSFVRKQLRKVK